jgi:tetratricopeptide (TPR) repeat protein
MEAEDKESDTLYNSTNIGISFIKEEKDGKSSQKKEETKEKATFDEGKFEIQYHKEIENLENDLSTNPKDTFKLEKLAFLYKILGNFDKSIEAIDKLLVMEPENEEYKKDKITIEKMKKEKNELKKKKKRIIQK